MTATIAESFTERAETLGEWGGLTPHMTRSRQEWWVWGMVMVFSLLVMALLDAEGWYNSPFIIPVAGCAMVLGIVVASIWAGVRSQEIKSHERLAKIAQGIPVEPDWDQAAVKAATASAVGEEPAGFQGYRKLKEYQHELKERQNRPNDGARAHRAGSMLCSIAGGLIVFFAFLAVVLRERDVFAGAAAGIIPLAIGIGSFVDARHRRRDYERWMETMRPSAAGMDTVTASTPVPPPPPAGMSAAQASDWRPLH